MELEINTIDAFTDNVFGGNQAAVIVTGSWLPEDMMQSIASENNLSETAFLVKEEANTYGIRWFSPITEIAFCGHATLASAFVLFNKYPDAESFNFKAEAVGVLPVTKNNDSTLKMNFPNTSPKKVTEIPLEIQEGLSIQPDELYANQQAYFVIYKSEKDVLSVERNNEILKRLKPLDVVVTCQSETPKYDFISRYFWPANGGDEDPVTGSIHTGLAPFWASRLGKSELTALQASKRGGILYCSVDGDRVYISGNAVQYLKGTITV
ncbi:PhzF family phenazine biosynthesis protein [Sedimenticola sp.]|uniref:PhzF family phenazine biosynthesis protein n=1 Tax=Sedimenticola sp. TaxID=1940285 RepID=UPI003D0D35B8